MFDLRRCPGSCDCRILYKSGPFSYFLVYFGFANFNLLGHFSIKHFRPLAQSYFKCIPASQIQNLAWQFANFDDFLAHLDCWRIQFVRQAQTGQFHGGSSAELLEADLDLESWGQSLLLPRRVPCSTKEKYRVILERKGVWVNGLGGVMQHRESGP